MSTADSKGVSRRIIEIDELIKHRARQYKEGDQRTAAIAQRQINQLLEKRRELLKSLGKEVPSGDTLAMLDDSKISSNSVIIGNLNVSIQRSGTRNKIIGERYCPRCNGLINYDEVYPDLDIATWELSSVGCRCP